IGAHIQLGVGGPVLIVGAIDFESAQSTAQPIAPAARETVRNEPFGPGTLPEGPNGAPKPAAPVRQQPTPGAGLSPPSGLDWVSGAAKGAGRIHFSKKVTTFGRDPENDIV